jgi:hypothetical protein
MRIQERYRESLRSLGLLLSRLSRRERWVVGGGALLIFLLFGYLFILSPMLDRLKLFDQLIPRKEREMTELNDLAATYAALSSRLSEVEGRIRPSADFSILSFVEETAGRTQVRGNIAYIRPLAFQTHEKIREVPVEVKVENLTLSRLVGFLSAVEQGPALLRVRRLSLKTRFADPQFMDATFVVSSYERE